VTLVALAPLTNIAAMIARDPAGFAKLHEVVLMGGSIRRGYDRPDGSANPVAEAEYNIACNPQALRALLASRVPVRMMPLDSTQVRPDAATLARIYARMPMLGELTAEWRRLNPWQQIRPTLFDAATVAAAIDPALCPARPMRIAVDDRGFTRAQKGSPNVAGCLSSNGDAIVARMAMDLAQK
jgi:inosine-uridine nucleoside N-ribohydrolase